MSTFFLVKKSLGKGKDCKTNVEGVAAGDVTNSSMREMITAASEGSVAANGAHELLMKRKLIMAKNFFLF